MASERRIKVFTRSINDELYRVASSLFPPEWPAERVIGATALGYLEGVLTDSSVDMAVNIDEDAFVTDPEALRRLVCHVREMGYANAGVSDGGMIPHRDFNPVTTNPFFNVFDVSQVRARLTPGVFVGAPLEGPEAERLLPANIRTTAYRFGYHESYDELFSWMAATFKTLYLEVGEHDDGTSTVVLNHLGEPFLVHSWYAREYLRDPVQTRRINAVIDDALAANPLGTPRSAVEKARLWLRLTEFRAGRKVYVSLKRRYKLV